ncbi:MULTISPECIES: hypothetical protein [Allobacillus]|uniref:DUF4352 domain-containing protein n=1 Tax=Allobacillus salarius TaxID=1955272 RepID=A0A556PP86_9BACI|nr:hypothetical protein [Allobacillus salarius]TSJ66193.1 hypothetical protein FPQ13_04795 [Allobacillus salarius]
MSKRFFLLCFMLIFTVTVAVACNSESDDEATNDQENSTQSSEDKNAQDSEESESDSDDTQNDDSTESELNDDQSSNDTNDDVEKQSTTSDERASNDDKELPETIEINEQIQHEEGVTFTLEKISFKEDHITVDFNAENHSGFKQYLASGGRAKSSNLGGITLQDNTGYNYRYVADDDSDRIKLEDMEKVTATVSFAGRIQDDAQSLTLIFNPDNVEPQFNFEDIEIEW